MSKMPSSVHKSVTKVTDATGLSVTDPEAKTVPLNKSLSASQQMVLDFIEGYSEQNQRPPTVREIQGHCGFKSPRAVSYIIEKLEEARLILRQAHSRGLFSMRSGSNRQGSPQTTAIQIPLFDSIPAGLPDRFEGGEAGNTLRFVPSTLCIQDPRRAFSVRVKGESMIEAGILDGDIVVLEKKEAQPGDIVAALIDGETTLKRLVKQNGQYHLKAENPRFPDLYPMSSLSIQGVVVSVLRQLAGIPSYAYGDGV